MLATVQDDGESSTRVAGLRDAWSNYMATYTSSVKDADPEHIASTSNTSELMAAWRWYAQYYPPAVARTGEHSVCCVVTAVAFFSGIDTMMARYF